MLASEVPIRDLRLPVLATPKIDGIRCLTLESIYRDARSHPVSRSLKEIRNTWLYGLLSKLPPHLDGELVAGETFQECQSYIMSYDGWGFDFKYYVFDYILNPKDSYSKRVEALRLITQGLPDWVIPLIPKEIETHDAVVDEMEKYLSHGWPHEGLVVRPGWSEYKFGRSTPRQQWMTKLKLFNDSEARVVGFEEKLENQNKPELDELGYQKRSTSKKGMVPAGTLGSLLVEDIHTGVKFSCGSGLNDDDRRTIWDNQEVFLGKTIKYKWHVTGVKDKPRAPIFLGFRNVDDMDR